LVFILPDNRVYNRIPEIPILQDFVYGFQLSENVPLNVIVFHDTEFRRGGV